MRTSVSDFERRPAPAVTGVTVNAEAVRFALSDAVPSRRRWRGTRAWRTGRRSERAQWWVIGRGEGLHRPALDEDIRVEGVLGR